jgi:hypothetical protein
MINIVLTVVGFPLLKGVFLVLFAREHRLIEPGSRLDGSNGLRIDLGNLDSADYEETSGTDVAAQAARALSRGR